MHSSINNLIQIKDKIKFLYENDNNIKQKAKIIAVSKTFAFEQIKPLIEYGHIHFGENKVQEATDKWTKTKNENPNIQLHLIGKLQTNKVKHAVKLFDYIHSVDNLKLAKKISDEQKKINKKLKIFIQVNTGLEEQKSGIDKKKLKELYDECKDLDLNLIGLMCIPPVDEDASNHFIEMKSLANELNLTELSMGMSADYLEAIKCGSTFIRVGSKIFGERFKKF